MVNRIALLLRFDISCIASYFRLFGLGNQNDLFFEKLNSVRRLRSQMQVPFVGKLKTLNEKNHPPQRKLLVLGEST